MAVLNPQNNKPPSSGQAWSQHILDGAALVTKSTPDCRGGYCFVYLPAGGGGGVIVYTSGLLCKGCHKIFGRPNLGAQIFRLGAQILDPGAQILDLGA